MKYTTLLLLFFSTILSAQDFTVDYATSYGGTSYDVSNSLHKDVSGNVYTCGTFADDITFNSVSGPITFNSAGNGDSYVAKFDETGTALWAHQIGNSNNCEATAITTDPSGNVYVIGRFLGTVDFDPGPGVDELFGNADFYLVKYDANGNYQWVRNFNSIASEALTIQTDAAGDIFVSGLFEGTVSYFPAGGGPLVNFQSSLSGQAENVFIAKYNTNGEIYYIRGLDTFSMNIVGSGPNAIDIDENGNVYLTGFFGFEVDFDPGPSQFILEGTGSSADIFVLKLTNSGNFVWARSMGGDGQDVPRGIAVDGDQNVLIGGDFRDTADFDPGAGVFELTSNGNIDAFVVKLNDLGDFEWAKSFGGANGDRVAALDTDILGDVYSFGNFVSTVDFDTDPGEQLEITSNGQSDIFLHKLTSDGNFIYVKTFGATSFDAGTDITLDEDFNVYLTGEFRNTVDFDPESGVLELTSVSSRDSFLLKLDSTLPPYSDINIVFQDPNFKNALVNTNCVVPSINGSVPTEDADSNDDGEINYGEAAAIQVLFVYNNNINSMNEIEHFVNLDRLLANNNNITQIDVSENDLLQTLGVENNNIDAIEYHPYLKRLQMDNNNLTSFEIIENSLLFQLNLFNNEITTLDLAQGTDLQNLNVSNNPLASIDLTQNDNLRTFNSLNTLYTSIDFSENTVLEDINLFNNPLTDLDLSNNTFMESIFVDNNQLESLIVNSDALEDIDCVNNNLTSIDLDNAPNLYNINASNNNLTSLDISLNVELNTLELQNNQLETLFLKNGSTLAYLGFANNPDVSYVCIDDYNPETGSAEYFQVLQILEDNGITDYQISDYCSFLPGGDYYEVSGETRFDINNNGCDSGDNVYPNMPFTVSGTNGNGLFFNNTQGAHFFPLQEGAYTITPNLENQQYYTVNPAAITVDFPADGDIVNQDFCIEAEGVHPDLDIVIMPDFPAIPGFEATYTLVFHNKGNQVISDEIILVYQNLLMTFESSSETPIAVDDNAITFGFTDMLPFETRQIDVSFVINTPVDPNYPVVIDDVLNFTAQISPVNGDETPEDNLFTLEQVVVGSYDPNDIICLQGDEIPLNDVGEYVHYRIRFENTGTFPAQNVVVNTIIDTEKYDPSSLLPLSASHAFTTRVNDGNNVDFIFENIQLPIDDENNDGFILYKIKTRASLNQGDTFASEAAIYFDFNAPIITNTATTIVTEPLSIGDKELLSSIFLYPNPTQEVLSIAVPTLLEVTQYSLYSSTGRKIVSHHTFESTINVQSLSSGLYFIEVESDKGSTILKFVKK